MNQPNFFIAGAPKCGTTSMYNYLRSHPQVFMPRTKEPHYFMVDDPPYRRMVREDEYLALFSAAGPEHLAIGEASVWYLYSRDALPLVREFNPAARILVFFRNPVDFVQSMYAQLEYNAGREPDFAAAWANPQTRAYLVARGSFGEQFQRLRAVFPEEQILSILQDDLRTQPRDQYLRVLSFLALEDDGRTDFSTFNAHKVHRAPWLSRFAKNTPEPIANAWQVTKQSLGIRRLGLMKKIWRLNTKSVQRQVIDLDLRQSIHSTFADDIALLSQQMGRDLAHWK